MGVIFTLFLCALSSAGGQSIYPPPAPPKDPSKLGLGIQRTMTLLATSTPAKRNKVKILFYGQSITEQSWWKAVADDLRRRFPYADIEIENKAIGGFASQLLVRPAEHDVYPFYPDLVIFHVYGGNKEYEEIIRNIRSRTTAEVLMQKDHVTRWLPEVPDEKTDKAAWWDHMMNNVFLPEIAAKYGCALLDIRSDWLDYLKSNNLEPKALLSDDVHLNDWGNYLMAELVKRYLVYRPDIARSNSWQDTVKTYNVAGASAGESGETLKWKNGRLVLAFEGNRVDVISAYTGRGKQGTAQVLIDGKKPSEFPTLYSITRPTPGPWSPLALTRVDYVSPLKAEEWTLTITSVSEDSSRWEFEVVGSVTGPDGRGSSDAVFVSKSGRVKIEPASFFRNGKIPKGYQIKWKVVPMHVDVYKPPRVEDPSREYVTTLAQGLPNTKHVLELVASDGKAVPVKAIRVYRPPVR